MNKKSRTSKDAAHKLVKAIKRTDATKPVFRTKLCPVMSEPKLVTEPLNYMRASYAGLLVESLDPRQLCNASVVLDEGLTAIVKTGTGGIGPPS